MQKLSQWDRFLGSYFPWFVLACATTGVLFPDTFSWLNGSITMGLFAFMTFSNSLGGGFRELGRVFLRPLPVVITLVLLHVVIPLLTLGLGNLLFPDAPLFTIGLVLEYVIPTGVASLMWVGICGGNEPLCLSIVLLDTLAAPVVIPLSLKLLVGSVVEVDTWGMMGDMLVMATVFLLCLFGFLAGYWAAKLLGLDFPTRATMCLNTGLRNISAGSVLALQYFPAQVVFPVAFTPLFLQFTTSIIVKVLMRTPSGRAYAAERERASAE